MKRFTFVKNFKNGLYSFYYIREEQSFFDKSWRGLFDPTVSSVTQHFDLSSNEEPISQKTINVENFENCRLTHKTPFNQYCINNVNREEVAIYLGLIWRLSGYFTKYGIPGYYRETTAEILSKKFDNVLWEYKVENEDLFKDMGFESAESWQGDPGRVVDGAGLFEVGSFHDLVLMQNSVQRDASSNLNLFCLKSPQRKNDLIRTLNDKEKPDLNRILQNEEIFINLAVGSDPGYCDALLIKSKQDIEKQLNKILEEYKTSISNYEKSVGKIKTLDQFLAAIAKIINIYPSE
jgi:hypothetical protein